MKTIKLTVVLCISLFTGNLLAQQTQQINLADSTGMPGDNFSLEGALALFKESKSLEDFEKKLNTKDNVVNNLDLDGDGKVDYVRIVSDKKGDNRIVIIQIPVTKTESQDVAVIEIEKNGEKSAFVQILGDEDLYGETRIVEPKVEEEPADPGVNKKGPAGFYNPRPQIFVNVWFWPCVSFMYEPVYVVYVSPWYWGYWPGWWTPWYPYPWRYYYMHNWHHHHHYHYVDHHRTTNAHVVYAPRRSRSNTVSVRYRDAHTQYKETVRPRSSGGVQTRPAAKPGSRQETQPQTRPSAKPGQIYTKPDTRPSQPQGKPSTKPDRIQKAPDTKPQSRPETKPQSRPERSPQVKPQSRPQNQMQGRPQSQPKNSQRNPR